MRAATRPSAFNVHHWLKELSTLVFVVNHLHPTKPIDELRESFEKEGLPLLARQPGFIESFLVKSDEYHGIAIIVWDDRASPDNGGKVMGPTWFHDNVALYLSSEQLRSVNDVVVMLKSK